MKLPKHDLHFGEKLGSLRCRYAGGREVKFPCFNTLRDWSGSQFKLELCQFTAPVFHCRSSEIWSRQPTPVITAFLLPSSSMPTQFASTLPTLCLVAREGKCKHGRLGSALALALLLLTARRGLVPTCVN